MTQTSPTNPLRPGPSKRRKSRLGNIDEKSTIMDEQLVSSVAVLFTSLSPFVFLFANIRIKQTKDGTSLSPNGSNLNPSSSPAYTRSLPLSPMSSPLEMFWQAASPRSRDGSLVILDGASAVSPANSESRGGVQEWDAKNIANYLIGVAPQLSQYKESIISSGIIGTEFLCLTPEKIDNRLGITDRGDVLIIMTLIRVLLVQSFIFSLVFFHCANMTGNIWRNRCKYNSSERQHKRDPWYIEWCF